MTRFWLLVFVCLTPALWAQQPNLRFEWLSNKEGLPSNTVNVAGEDERGFMWFGTRKSLSRYDGYTFRNINIGQVYGLASNRAGALYVSSEMAGQLLRVNTTTKHVTRLVPYKEGGAFSTFVDSFGNVWFSDRNGVTQYNPATRKRRVYSMRQTTFLYHKGSFAEDADKNLWIVGMETGLFCYNRQADSLRCVFGPDCPRPNMGTGLTMRAGFFDQQGMLWIAAERAGLMRYNPRTGELKRFELPNGQIFCLCPDTDAAGKPIIWIGTEKGLYRFMPDTETFQSFVDVLPVPFIVQHIYHSAKTGIVWFCTTEGLIRYNPHNQAIQTNRLPNVPVPGRVQTVNAFLTDRTNPSGQTVWMAVSYGGLLRWNRRDNTTRLFRYPGRAGGALEAAWLVQDKQNKIWVGGNQWDIWNDGKIDDLDKNTEGVYRFDPKAERFLDTPFSVHHTFFSVPFFSLGLMDRRGRFWLVNHYEGVHVLDPATKRELSLWDKPSHDALMANGNWVMKLFEDRQGRIWLGTNQGLYYFDEARRQFVVSHRHFSTGDSVLDITQDKAGNLWVVGWHLLAKLSPQGNVIRQWSEKDGLYDGECRRIAVDAQNRVWIGTYDGLHVLDEAQNTIRRLTINDGLLSNSTMAGLQISVNNDLLVGQAGGWNTLNTQTASHETVPNNPQITDIRINNQEFEQNGQQPFTLTHDQNAIGFDFSAMNFLNPAYTYYTYKLDGFDDKWVDAGHNHQASYTNLPPGAYTFRVQVDNELSRHQISQLAVPFTIAPAFYQTGWFKVLVALLVMGLLTYIYRSRLSYQTVKAKLELEEVALQRQEAKYNEEVAAYQLKLSETEMAALRSQMNPHFIFNCLNSIQFFTAQNDSEKASDYLTKFSRLIRLVLENSRSEKVTLANELDTLRLYIEMEAMRFPQKLHYRIRVDDWVDVDSIQMPPLLLQPFVENAIWHGLMHKEEGGTVTVQIQQNPENLLHIEITDDGIGRQRAAEFKSKSATKHKSFGMKLTADRIELINQLYQIRTQVNVVDLVDAEGRATGTSVLIEIPV